MVSFSSQTGAIELARGLAQGLSTKGYVATEPESFGDGAGFTARVQRLSLLVLVVPDKTEPNMWSVTIGRGVLPAGRLFGLSDSDQRGALGDAIDSQLRRDHSVSGLRWFTAEAWGLLHPAGNGGARRRWWQPRDNVHRGAS